MRYPVLDGIRGITLISMIVYHGVWDLVYLFGRDWAWYQSDLGYIWQQSICWTFIILSGFCWSFSRHKVKHGLTVFLAGALITLVTLFAMPGQEIWFGVLTLLGSSSLLLIPLESFFEKIKPGIGFGVAVMLFVLFRNVNEGYLGFESWNLWKLPEVLYQNLVTAYFGFPAGDFYSSDYFSIFPWLLLFIAGYFLYRMIMGKDVTQRILKKRIYGFDWIGKYSLMIYLLHQPVLYFIFKVYNSASL